MSASAVRGLRVGSLFSGYGGLDLAIEQFFGATTAWHVEFDEAPSAVLRERWPGVPNFGDVSKVDWARVEPVDILGGGFPCQDLSLAGRRKGMRPGTRSGLWSDFVEAIRALSPSVVVIENVRGLLSGCAESDLGPCPGCVGDGDHRPPLRALGRVLGDLADLGFDAEWAGVRASDVGAPHQRFRVFVLAYRAGLGREWAEAYGLGRSGSALRDLSALTTLPTPRASDGEKGGPNQRGSKGDLTLPGLAGALFRTPAAAEAEGGPRDPNRPGATMRLTDQVREEQARGVLVPIASDRLLPTPVVNDMGEGKSLEWWDEWQPRQKASDGTPAPHGRSLAVELLRSSLLPTTTAADADSSGGSNAQNVTLTDAVTGRRGLEAGEPLLPTPTSALADGGSTSRSGERKGEALLGGIAREATEGTLMPTPRATRGGSSTELMYGLGAERSDEGDAQGNVTVRPPANAAVAWGQYEPAVRRWEALTRPAPAPTLPDGRDGQHRLSAAFAEWMMGLPARWLTEPELGLTRREQLKACGNGVVPQQAVAALAGLWDRVLEVSR